MHFRADQRLRRQQDFRAAREQGRRIDCGGFTFWYVQREMDVVAESPKIARARVGVVASTAAVGIAVRRNRAKRRLREIFRRHQSLVPRDHDLLLVAKSSVNRLAFAELEKKFLDACRRAFPPAP